MTPEQRTTVGDEDLDLQWVRSRLIESLRQDERITPLRGFRFDLSGRPEHRKIFFAARCSCGTAALLSVELPRSSSRSEVAEALPRLAQRLWEQVASFYEIPCEAHGRLALGRRPHPDPLPEGEGILETRKSE